MIITFLDYIFSFSRVLIFKNIYIICNFSASVNTVFVSQFAKPTHNATHKYKLNWNTDFIISIAKNAHTEL